MLAPIKHVLGSKRVILASGSPRRKELVNLLGLNAELCPSTFQENLKPSDFKDFASFVEETALGKAVEVFDRLKETDPKADLLVIAADTMVTLGSKIFGKPKDANDAINMLSQLSGRCHVVHTGVVLKYQQGVRRFTETVKVHFGELTSEQIRAYVNSGEPLDKAGAYGIQGIGGAMVSKIDGDFYCVMGLPLHRLSCELCELFTKISP